MTSKRGGEQQPLLPVTNTKQLLVPGAIGSEGSYGSGRNNAVVKTHSGSSLSGGEQEEKKQDQSLLVAPSQHTAASSSGGRTRSRSFGEARKVNDERVQQLTLAKKVFRERFKTLKAASTDKGVGQGHIHSVPRSALMVAREVYNEYNTDNSGYLKPPDAMAYMNDLLVLSGKKKKIIKQFRQIQEDFGQHMFTVDTAWRGYLRRSIDLMDYTKQGYIEFEMLVQPFNLTQFLKYIYLEDLRSSSGDLIFDFLSEKVASSSNTMVNKVIASPEELLEQKRVKLIRLKAKYKQVLHDVHILEVRLGQRPWC
mmetsp:Transcript_21167/g.31503  ORF Transcript_21167/g.31503 Transcript_21167/m.31503 type:complete len:310 (-) Transcript_21167:908-1837(-)